jgi:hypothetical protein
VAVVVPGCGVLCWWQVNRALSGNTLSWAYVFEWPIFGGYAVFMWWKLIHDPPPGDRSPAQAPSPGVGANSGNGTTDLVQDREAGVLEEQERDKREKEDEELASYNRYLAALNASGKRKHW